MKIKTFIGVLVLGLAVCSSAYAATFNIYVTPQGDGMWGKDRWGYSSWEATGSPNGNEVGAYHWSEYGDGSWRNGYLEFGISQFTGNPDDITSITFNYNLLRTRTDGRDNAGDIYHVTNSSAATGNASDKLSGGTLLEKIAVGASTGWRSIDVTSYVLNDLTQGYSWSSFLFQNTGYAGFFASSAESLSPAFLSITTAGMAATPIPPSFLLLGSGLLGLPWLRKKGFGKA